MAGLAPAIHVFLAYLTEKTWMPGASASGSDAVLRTAMAGRDEPTEKWPDFIGCSFESDSQDEDRRKRLSRDGMPGGEVKNQVVGIQRLALDDEAEGASALRAFILPHVMTIAGGLDADQGSFEVAGKADWCRGHVCRPIPGMVVESGALYRGYRRHRLIWGTV